MPLQERQVSTTISGLTAVQKFLCKPDEVFRLHGGGVQWDFAPLDACNGNIISGLLQDDIWRCKLLQPDSSHTELLTLHGKFGKRADRLTVDEYPEQIRFILRMLTLLSQINDESHGSN
jgi:hypothetical protein